MSSDLLYLVTNEREREEELERRKRSFSAILDIVVFFLFFFFSFHSFFVIEMIHEELKKIIKDRFSITAIPSRIVVVITVWNINNNNSSLMACVYCTRQSEKEKEKTVRILITLENSRSIDGNLLMIRMAPTSEHNAINSLLVLQRSIG